MSGHHHQDLMHDFHFLPVEYIHQMFLIGSGLDKKEKHVGSQRKYVQNNPRISFHGMIYWANIMLRRGKISNFW